MLEYIYGMNMGLHTELVAQRLNGVVGDDVGVKEGSALGEEDREGTCVGTYDGD